MNPIRENHQIQGIKLLDLANQFDTPSYVYDADIIERQVNTFRNAFEGIDLKIKFAMKSCSNISIVKLMKKLGTGLDTVSIPEIMTGIMAGFTPDEIVFTPNVVDFQEIREAIKIGTAINIENLSNLEKLGMEYGSSVPVFIRLNPNIIAEANNEKVTAWHHQSKFGISLSQFDQLRSIVSKYKIRVHGLHIHSSHVIMSPEVFLKGAQTIFKLAEEFKDLEYFDFGGGIKVAHTIDEEVIDIMDLGKKFKSVFLDFCKKMGRNIQLWFEPGRFLVSESGVLLTRAEVLKTNGTVDFVGVNTGFNHLIRPMMYDAHHDIINLSNPQGKPKQYTIVGNLCEIDNFAKNRELPEVREKDILAILNAGAYGFSMSSEYNSRFKPAEVLVYKGKPKLIRDRGKFDDFLRNQIEIDF